VTELKMTKLALFDFDGTITSRDSLIDFIIFTFGWKRFLIGFLWASPMIAAFMLRMMSGAKVKEKLLGFHVAGIKHVDLKALGAKYSTERLPDIVRQNALQKIRWHRTQGHKVAVVSASMEPWLEEWCKRNDLDLIATRLDVKSETVTGKFASKNCMGPEKVKRIREKYDLKEFLYIYAYGDSFGDKEMLALADEKYFKWKRVIS
jgi:phosphatidylglycerophosphatase C